MKLFQIGIRKELKLSATLIEKILLTNRFIVSVLGVLLIYVLVYSVFAQYLLALGMLIAFFAAAGALLLNHLSSYVLARYLFLTACNLVILFADVCFHYNASVETYYFPSILVSFLLFEVTETKHLAVSLFWPFLFWFAPRLLAFDVGSAVPPVSANIVTFLRYQNSLGALSLTVYFAYIFFRSLAEFQKVMVTSNKFTALGEMAAGIAHEINNPISVISGKASLLRKKISAGSASFELISKDLDKIEMTATRIGKIVKGLRNFSRTDDSDPFEVVPVVGIIEDVLSLCQDKLAHHGIKVQASGLGSYFISCRQHQIAQVILNLLNNSADAIEGSTEPWIKIEVQLVEARLQIWITDSGQGIAPHVVSKMMHPFFTTKEVGKGTGLGLSISKGILESHNGQLVYDAKSLNTRFILDLPVAKAPVAEDSNRHSA